MTTYLKTPKPYLIFMDPQTRIEIGQKKIVAVESLSREMKKRIQQGGLVECTKEEFDAQFVVPETKPEEPAPAVSPSVEEKVPEEAPPAEPSAEETVPETKPTFKGFGKGKKK